MQVKSAIISSDMQAVATPIAWTQGLFSAQKKSRFSEETRLFEFPR
jgi:hypothetical protein